MDEISVKLNIPFAVVKKWVMGEDGDGRSKSCWLIARASIDQGSIVAYVANKLDVFERSTGLALSCLEQSLVKLNENIGNGYSPNIDEIRKLASVVTDMDKIGRLESGKATAIIENTGLTPTEIRRIIAEDPITEDVFVEFKELDDI